MRPVIVETFNNHFNTEIFDWLIPQGSLIYALAFVTVLVIFVYRSSKIGLSPSHAFWSGIWAIAFGLMGSRIYYLLQHTDTVWKSPDLIFTGGSGSWGGYIGGALGLLLSLKLYRAQILKYMDVAGSTFGLGIFISRWSCYLHGCCFGAISSVPWAVRFPHSSYVYSAHLSEGLITCNAQMSLPVHPVQIYASLNGLILFILAYWYWKWLRYRPGVTFCLFWLSYCITRFVLEFFRGDKIRGFIGPLSTPQFICVLFIAPLLFGLWRFLKSSDNSHIKGGINDKIK